MLNLLLGKSNSKIELGFGATIVTNQTQFLKTATTLLGTATIAYRYQLSDGGFFFKVGFTPFINSDGTHPFFGISLGTIFN